MKAKRYKITIVDSILEMTHGFGQTITEIRFDNGLTINRAAIFKSEKGRMKDATYIEEIEVDDLLFNLFTHYESLAHIAISEAKRIIELKGKKIESCEQTPILNFDDFEKKYLPMSRKERLEALETPEEASERLAKESLERIKKSPTKPPHTERRRKK
jgi:hypothetical protein